MPQMYVFWAKWHWQQIHTIHISWHIYIYIYIYTQLQKSKLQNKMHETVLSRDKCRLKLEKWCLQLPHPHPHLQTSILFPSSPPPGHQMPGTACRIPRGLDYQYQLSSESSTRWRWMINRRRTLETGILSPCCLRIKSPVHSLSLSSCAPSPSDRAFRSKHTPMPDFWMIELYVVC